MRLTDEEKKQVGATRRVLSATAARSRTLELLTAGDLIRTRYRDGETILGTFVIEIPSRGVVRALALAGFDFLVLDLEHSPLGFEGLSVLIAEAQSLNVPAFVRVWSHDPGLIGKVIDMGASGIMVPHVASRSEAVAVIDAARYYPRGNRGLAPLISYSTAMTSQTDLGDSVIVLLQIEGALAIGEAGDIAAVDGVDGLFVGPFDLSQSLGRPGQLESAAVVDAAMAVARACGSEKIVGLYVDDPLRSPMWVDRGFRLQCVSFDGRMLLDAATAVLHAAESKSVSPEGM